MTASLARLLRQSISNEDEVVPVAREVEYARAISPSRKCVTKTKWNLKLM